MGFGVLFLMLLVVAGWWLYSRWSALRDAQDARREAEAMFVIEARSLAGRPAGPHVDASVSAAHAPAGDFMPTRPGNP